MAPDLSWPESKDLSAVVSLQDFNFSSMLLALKVQVFWVQALNLAAFYSHQKQMLDLAGDTILFPHPCHCAHLKKNLEDPTFGQMPSWSGLWMGFLVPPGVSQPQTLCWGPKVACTTAWSITLPAADDPGESQIWHFHPCPAMTHPLTAPRSSWMT